MAENTFEIPQAMRDLVEQNVKQAHAAYEQLNDFVTKAMGAWTGAMPTNPVAAGFKDAQDRFMAIVKENGESAFTFAGKVSNAGTFQELLTLQTQFAQDRMQAFVTQMQQLFTLIDKAIQKSESVATVAGTDATPSTPVVTGLKDVQDRAVEIAEENAESAFVPLEEIAEAQNVPAPSDNEKPARRKSAKSKTATSDMSMTPPRKSPRSRPKAAKKEPARDAASLKDK